MTSKKLNILVLSWRDTRHPLAGGAEQVMHQHMKGWVEAGHKVVFFSSKPKGASQKEIIDGVEVIRQGSQYLTAHMFAFFWYIFGKHPKFDLVVDQFHGWPGFTPFYIRKPKIAVIQELTREVWFRYPLPLGLNYILGGIGYLIEPLFFLFYKQSLLPGSKNIPFITGSKSAKEELQTVGINPKQIHIIPHGVIIESSKEKFAKEKTPTVIFLGALASDKGIEDAIKAFGLISAKSGKFNFWIVGKGEEKYLKYLKNLASRVGLTKNVTFYGFVTQEKKFELLARAHIMINPSIREGWGLVNIEANSMGTPVVAYKSKGLTDSVIDKKTGLICEENLPSHLAKLVLKLVKENKLYKDLQIGALKWSKEFTWEKSKKQSLELIERIANEN